MSPAKKPFRIITIVSDSYQDWKFSSNGKSYPETTPREPYDGYLIYQEGVPEVEDFIKKFHE